MTKIDTFIQNIKEIRNLPTKVYVPLPIYDENNNTLTISNRSNLIANYSIAMFVMTVIILTIWYFLQNAVMPVQIVFLWILLFALMLYINFNRNKIHLILDFNNKTLLVKKKCIPFGNLISTKNILLHKKTLYTATVIEANGESKYIVIFKGSPEQCQEYSKAVKKLLL